MFFIHYNELYKHYGSRNRSKWVTTIIITARQNTIFSYLMLGRKLYFMFAFGIDKLVHINQSHCKYRKYFKIPDWNDPWNSCLTILIVSSKVLFLSRQGQRSQRNGTHWKQALTVLNGYSTRKPNSSNGAGHSHTFLLSFSYLYMVSFNYLSI